ncbi:MAG TPA: FAD-dependent oxidoreductase, partial [Acidimicrobiales bacterium]|nr:FAD-dependent oxidoreductase [Acidimicrobiales bacterium]
LLHLLFLVHAHHRIERLFSIEGGAQENLVDGGMGAFAGRVAAELGDAVHLGTPVRSIAQHGYGVVLAAGDMEVHATRCVVTTPPALTLDIAFSPDLPDDRRALYRQAVGGVETKTLVVYDEPFWRDDGLSGQSAGAGTPSEVTIDASPGEGPAGVLASFAFGPVAARLATASADDRRTHLLDTLSGRFGPKAARPEAVVETAWFTEPWSRGCSLAHLPPGALTRSGRLLREPFGRVHWAGTETATVSHGAVDGAIRSGDRVAEEVLSELEPG